MVSAAKIVSVKNRPDLEWELDVVALGGIAARHNLRMMFLI
jgi:hypothetical protein